MDEGKESKSLVEETRVCNSKDDKIGEEFCETSKQVESGPQSTTVPHLDEISEESKSEVHVNVDENTSQNDGRDDNFPSEDEIIALELLNHNMSLVVADENTPKNIYTGDAFITEQVFNTDRKAIEWMEEVARNIGIVLIRWRSDYSKGRSPYVKYACERVDKPRKGYVKKVGGVGKGKPRNTFSKKCDFPFLLLLKMDKAVSGWRVSVTNGYHNHDLNNSDLGYSFKGRLSKDELDLVASLSKSGTCPKDILKALRDKNRNNATSVQTIYNPRVKFNKIERNNRTVIQEVFHKAREEDVFFRYLQDGETITHVFWVPKDSFSLMKNFPHVYQIDCTYKTNRYKFPFLQIVGVTSTNMTFSIGFAFLANEKIPSYELALRKLNEALITIDTQVKVIVTDKEEALMSAIRTVFPSCKNLLCQWHVEKAVQAKVRQSLKNSEKCEEIEKMWKAIVYSDTEEEYLAGVAEIKTKVSESVFNYLEKNWFDDCKEQYVNVWTNKVFHLGNTHTSKVEGAHAVLRNWLGTSNCDVATGWKSVTNMCVQQFRNILASFEISRTKWPSHLDGKTWCRFLRGCVSLNALALIEEEVNRSKKACFDLTHCECVIRQTHGIPCAHEIFGILKTRETLPRDCVHEHWKTLSLDGPSKDDIIDPTPHIARFVEVFNSSTNTQQMEMVQRLVEVVDPAKTTLSHPKVKINPRGRPKAKATAKRRMANDERSTTRLPSLFEHVDEKNQNILKEEDETSKRARTSYARNKVEEGLTSVDSKKVEKLTIRRVDPAKVENLIMGIKDLPDGWQEFTQSVIDVKGDGNCGYRAVSMAIGMPENEWPTIRRDLFSELQGNAEHYDKLFRMKELSVELLKGIGFKGKGRCNEKFWMKTPLIWVIAEKYNAIVTLFYPQSKGQTVTCFPTKQKPTDKHPLRITLLYKKKHYACVMMKEDCPLPPMINPWKEEAPKVSEEVSNAWLQLCGERVDKGERLLYPNGWSVDHIDIKN